MVLHWSITGEPTTMDPGIATDASSMDMINLAFEGLTIVDRQFEMINGTAESFTNSPDFTHFTFTLRKDAKWSNGDPVTAHDFEYAIKRNLDPKTASGYAYQLFYLKGGEEFFNGTGKAEDVGVKAKDDYTLDFTLRSPTPFFRELTSFTTYYPLHKKHWRAIRSGRTTPRPSSATARLSLTHGSIKPSSPSAKAPPIGRKASWWSRIIPAQKPLFSTRNSRRLPTKKIRQAFAYSINRQMLIDNILQTGVPPAYGWVPTSMGLNPDGYFKEDAEKAKQLLAEGMKELGLSEFPKVTYYYDTGETDKKIAQALQDEWTKTLGINIDIRTAEWKVFNEDVQNGKYDFGIWLWGADFNDPINFLEMYKDKEGGNNVVRFDNKEYRDLLNKSYYETDAQKRKRLMFDAEKILMEEMPLAPLHFRGNAYVKNDKVKDFVIFPLGGSYFKYAYIEK